MILESYKLIDFNPLPQETIHSIQVPEGSILYKLIVLPDGIYAFFGVPGKLVSLEGKDTFNLMTVSFLVVKTGQDIPNNVGFIDVLSESFEMPPLEGETEPRSGILLFPLFQMSSFR